MSRDTVNISEEAKKRFQELLDREIARRQNNVEEEEEEIINVQITGKNSDHMLYFSAGIMAAISLGIIGYLIGLLFKG